MKLQSVLSDSYSGVSSRVRNFDMRIIKNLYEKGLLEDGSELLLRVRKEIDIEGIKKDIEARGWDVIWDGSVSYKTLIPGVLAKDQLLGWLADKKDLDEELNSKGPVLVEIFDKRGVHFGINDISVTADFIRNDKKLGGRLFKVYIDLPESLKKLLESD